MRQMEEKIQSLTKNLQDLQSTLNTHLQQEINNPDFTEEITVSGGRNPADAAQPKIKETIHNIQAKLDQLDNRTQVRHAACFYLGELNVGMHCVLQSHTHVITV